MMTAEESGQNPRIVLRLDRSKIKYGELITTRVLARQMGVDLLAKYSLDFVNDHCRSSSHRRPESSDKTYVLMPPRPTFCIKPLNQNDAFAHDKYIYIYIYILAYLF